MLKCFRNHKLIQGGTQAVLCFPQPEHWFSQWLAPSLTCRLWKTGCYPQSHISRGRKAGSMARITSYLQDLTTLVVKWENVPANEPQSSPMGEQLWTGRNRKSQNKDQMCWCEKCHWSMWKPGGGSSFSSPIHLRPPKHIPGTLSNSIWYAQEVQRNVANTE